MTGPHSHRLPAKLLSSRVNVLLVGAGGTGSRILERLVCLHRALIAKGHPHGLQVTVADPDRVSPANIGRQAFYRSDIGCFKADVLVNRANMALQGAKWTSIPAKVDTRSGMENVDLVIGAVDNRSARLGILRSLENCFGGVRYWLDTGNRSDDGQVVLGQVPSRKRETDDKLRLPHAGELYPELIDPAAEDPDEGPSCSLAEALEKQSLFINPTVADFAMAIVWNLFTQGQIDTHGAFINLRRMMVTPLKVDPEVWTRFGVVRDGRRHTVTRPSAKARPHGSTRRKRAAA
ncbi:PRTRC system ThiF family protein [Ramlibacter albus]|jgi:PRTRC genetic system ThiF family protein|uniref:PRTRC system ThiF family protein n=1 Tax=Ramlibacter albus TaxID=2079448 RepID=A0A923MCE2_9BURK|nr:PRTRC system ThiF family protein [Ramlibacter albus]MBC5767596.1 PRTRC system ThiF family protein [Ramlibacter albus]